MKTTTSLLLATTLFFAVLPTTSARAADAPVPDAHAQLLAHLRTVAQPIALDDGRLSGQGADWIAQESERAQFVLIGEDHGMADIPQFATALWNASTRHPFDRLVIETGPYAAAALETAHDDDGIAALNARHPTSIPFFNWREDGHMAANAMRSERGTHALCGIDQEFIFSGRMLFRTLAAMAPDAAARKTALSYAERDDRLYREVVSKQNFNLSLFSQLQPDDFLKLKRAFTGRDDALSMIADIESSVDIYRLQESESYRSNAMRAALMKRNFMRCYREDLRRTSQPRALFRMGAFHVGRGLSQTGQFDIGNLASELAQSHGASSLHILVVAAGGASNRWYPFADVAAAKRTPYNAKEELEILGALPLLEVADTRQWTLFPLATLRGQGAMRRAGGDRFEKLVYSYDAVVVIPQVRAATLYSDPAN